MRDPAVLAVFALRVTAAEFATLASGAPIVRPYWPPVPCRGSVVGLQVGGEVLGEALISGVVAVAGATAWRSASGGVWAASGRVAHRARRVSRGQDGAR